MSLKLFKKDTKRQLLRFNNETKASVYSYKKSNKLKKRAYSNLSKIFEKKGPEFILNKKYNC